MASKKRIFTCIVPSCKQSSSKSELKFYQFPTNAERRFQWINSIGLSETDFINKYSFVCQRHFMPENIGKHFLTRNAVPVLNLIKDVDKTVNFEVPPIEPIEDVAINFAQDSPAVMISAITQTEEVEFLKIINKVNCYNCNMGDVESTYCDNCKKLRKLNFLYKKKLVLAERKLKSISTTLRKLRRNFNILKKKHTKVKNITTRACNTGIPDTEIPGYRLIFLIPKYRF